jgi:membrane-bound hydrogenase subunit alpha
MFEDQEIADIPIIAASIDPCICCMDRFHIVEGSREKVVAKEELLRLSWEKTRKISAQRGLRLPESGGKA